MTGETNLHALLRSMQPILHNGEFVFCTVPTDFELNQTIEYIGQFREDEGTTVILKREDADQCGLSYDYIACMITLSVHSSLSAVGFLAVVATRLAEHGISINSISAFYHDHLFVPVNRAEDAMLILQQLSNTI